VVQYWRSFDHLERFARDNTHRSAWANFYKSGGIRTGDVGFWHETYQIRAQHYEAVYGNMPRFGLAKAGQHRALTDTTARQRIAAADAGP
jgi:hypothetical protein